MYADDPRSSLRVLLSGQVQAHLKKLMAQRLSKAARGEIEAPLEWK